MELGHSPVSVLKGAFMKGLLQLTTHCGICYRKERQPKQ